MLVKPTRNAAAACPVAVAAVAAAMARVKRKAAVAAAVALFLSACLAAVVAAATAPTWMTLRTRMMRIASPIVAWTTTPARAAVAASLINSVAARVIPPELTSAKITVWPATPTTIATAAAKSATAHLCRAAAGAPVNHLILCR